MHPQFNPLIAHIPVLEWAEDFAEISNTALLLAERFWPGHADFATAVVPGLVSFTPADAPSDEIFMACYRGILVKGGETVSLSVRRAVMGSDLSEFFRRLFFRF